MHKISNKERAQHRIFYVYQFDLLVSLPQNSFVELNKISAILEYEINIRTKKLTIKYDVYLIYEIANKNSSSTNLAKNYCYTKCRKYFLIKIFIL